MATKEYFPKEEIIKGNSCFTRFRSVAETAFYGNNVHKIRTLKEAYELAMNSPGTIVTDHEINDPEKLGLEKGSKVLLFNDRRLVNRSPEARRLVGDDLFNGDFFAGELRETIFKERRKKFYCAAAYVGTDRDFMVKAHLLVPEGCENILFNWLLNFRIIDDRSEFEYENSLKLKMKEISIFWLFLNGKTRIILQV